jgi:hypothetical protein
MDRDAPWREQFAREFKVEAVRLIPGHGPDEAEAVGDRAAQARGCQAEG